MEELSNCCGAKIDGLNASGIGICSECKEGCGVEWVCGECGESANEGQHICDKDYREMLDKLSEQK